MTFKSKETEKKGVKRKFFLFLFFERLELLSHFERERQRVHRPRIRPLNYISKQEPRGISSAPCSDVLLNRQPLPIAPLVGGCIISGTIWDVFNNTENASAERF
ncbi:hypothetical protein CDAR_256381 [Caerostris darwini]|uniref:Uncharacterized protein n=1 Tax=Caerostris darwini TaxID=1538125 RepID=A0AAV4NCY7_9ARAC|nr:hypothetical protein CDAR_256381 [Caerostris darwini]